VEERSLVTGTPWALSVAGLDAVDQQLVTSLG